MNSIDFGAYFQAPLKETLNLPPDSNDVVKAP